MEIKTQYKVQAVNGTYVGVKLDEGTT